MDVRLTRVDLVVVGALPAAARAMADDFERRVGRYARLTVHEVRGEPLQRGADASSGVEGRRILEILDRGSGRGSDGGDVLRVACDPRGEQVTSEQFAERVVASPRLVLVIGGAAGLDGAVLERCAARVAFGRITLPHAIARIVATEQLYRAFRIARGEPYHH